MSASLVAAVDDDWVARLAADLVATPGHEELPQAERDVALLLTERLADAGVEARTVDIGDGRLNVLASLEDGAGPTLMLNGHLDTVPAYGMRDAFTPRWEDGRLRGRGAVDMKGALACMAGALHAMARAAPHFGGRLLLTAVAGEERGSPGMLRLAQDGPRADFAVVGEPTMLDVAAAHKGAMWIEVAFRGRSAHGSAPELGVNAVEHAAEFVARVREALRPRLAAEVHPLLGAATVNVGRIEGGDRPPMVPDRCVVQLDRRWLPAETHAGVLAQVRELAAGIDGADAEVREMDGTGSFVHHPLDTPADTPGLAALEAAIAEVRGTPPRRFGAAFWTDAALLGRAGTPAVVCGPGDIAQAHSSDEYVDAEQLRLATRAYLLTAAKLLRVRRPPG